MGRREEILDAAFSTFDKFGISKITMEDIANNCGLKKAALYYYFKNKEEILAEMISFKMEEIKQIMTQKVEAEKNAKDKLRAFMKNKIDLMQKNLGLMKLFEDDNIAIAAKKFLFDKKKCMADFDFMMVLSILNQGIKNNKVNCDDNDSVVLMILGVTYGTFVGKFVEDVRWDINTMVDTAIEVIFKGIGKNEI